MDKKLKTYIKPTFSIYKIELGSMLQQLQQKSEVNGGAGSVGNGGTGTPEDDANFRGPFDESEDWNDDNSLF